MQFSRRALVYLEIYTGFAWGKLSTCKLDAISPDLSLGLINAVDAVLTFKAGQGTE